MAAPSSLPAPGRVFTRDYKDTSIDVWWMVPGDLPSAIKEVRLFKRNFPTAWTADPLVVLPITTPPGSTMHYTAVSLDPTSTYEFKIAYGDGEGAVGPFSEAVAADTLAAGCVPKDKGGESKSSGCCIM
jgi:hypothetical protein